MTVLYNEIDPIKAEAIRELMGMGLIPQGTVDERSITELPLDYIREFATFHAFAGVAVWPYALRLAGWPDDRPVWTGSCPCQPFSKAGKRDAMQDERHLWPAWFKLIAHCQPDTVFGEQVSAEESIGSIQRTPSDQPKPVADWAWLDHVQFDLEAASYAVGHRSFTAACVGAPHSRGRLYFVADRSQARLEGQQFSGYDGHEWSARARGMASPARGGHVNGWWANWIPERDINESLRFIEPGIVPQLDGTARTVVSGTDTGLTNCNRTQEARVARIESYGDAIVAQQAALFVRSAMGVIE